MLRAFALFITLSTVAAIAGAQSYTTTSGSIAGGYLDIASPTTVTVPTLGVSGVIKPTGFSATFFGTTFTDFKIGANGYVLMDSNGSQIGKSPNVTAAPGMVIAPAWIYLDQTKSLYGPTSPSLPGPGTIGWDFNSGVLEVEWKNIPVFGSTSKGVRMKMSLDTGTGIITFSYGKPHFGATGATSTWANTTCIAGPVGATTQEIISGAIPNYILSDGSITKWPQDQFVEFKPATPANNPPAISVSTPAGQVANGGTLNVNYNIPVSALAVSITVSDTNNDQCALDGTVSNKGSTGINEAEWTSSIKTTPYTVNPTSGTFNTPAGVTHLVTLKADDGQATTTFTFSIVQAPQPAAPVMSVSDGSAVSYGQSAAGSNRDFGSRDITAGASSALTITISNTGNTDLVVPNIGLAGDTGDFVLDTSLFTNPVAQGTSSTFTVSFSPMSTGQKIAQVVLSHNDTTQTSPFSFEITGLGTQVATAPIIVVKESSSTGAAIAWGSTHDFGSMDLAQTPSLPFTVFIMNAGNADLTVGLPTSASGDFVVAPGSVPTTLTPGASATFDVTFTPSATGVAVGSVQFTHNDTGVGSPFVINLTGTATTSGTTPTAVTGGGGGGGCVADAGENLTWVFLLGLGACLFFRLAVGRKSPV